MSSVEEREAKRLERTLSGRTLSGKTRSVGNLTREELLKKKQENDAKKKQEEETKKKPEVEKKQQQPQEQEQENMKGDKKNNNKQQTVSKEQAKDQPQTQTQVQRPPLQEKPVEQQVERESTREPRGVTEKGGVHDQTVPIRAKEELAPFHHSKDQKRTRTHTFAWPYGGREAYVAGSFTDWALKKLDMTEKDSFATVVDLPPGHYQYKFVVDGQWVLDSAVPTEPDHDGNINNVVEVQ